MRQFTHGSLFSGIGGFDLGFERAGFKTVWQVEIDPFCRKVLEKHFPHVQRFSDIATVCRKGERWRSCWLANVDVISGGFPCQDVSVAGERAGLAGSRSGLFWELRRILGELRAPWVVIENVPGLFSSSEGRDFGVVLDALDEFGYGLAWRVFDAQFFGVAQRRERVFIVGCLGKPCPEAVLFDAQDGDGNFAQSRQTGTQVAFALSASVRASGDGHGNGWNSNYVVATLQGGGHSGQSEPGEHLVAATLNSGGNSGGFRTEPGEHIVRHAITASYGKQCDRAGTNGTGPANVIGCTPPNSNGVRDFAGLPKGMDSPRYKALGNAVVPQIAEWIAHRIKAVLEAEEVNGPDAVDEASRAGTPDNISSGKDWLAKSGGQ